MSAEYHQVGQHVLRQSTDEYVAENHLNTTEMHNRNGNGQQKEKPTEQRSFEPPLRTQTSHDIERVDTTEDDKVRFFQPYLKYNMLISSRSRPDQFDISTSFEGHGLFNTPTNRKLLALAMKQA